jgi:hypothetical protein
MSGGWGGDLERPIETLLYPSFLLILEIILLLSLYVTFSSSFLNVQHKSEPFIFTF